MEEENKIDQSAVAETVSNGIKYDFIEDFLVKPLDPVMVKKEFHTPVVKSDTKDENGIEAADYDEVATEVKEVESDYREGVVLKVSSRYQSWMDDTDNKINTYPIKVGDIIVFRATAGRYFDLFKDTVLIKQFDIIAVKKND